MLLPLGDLLLLLLSLLRERLRLLLRECACVRERGGDRLLLLLSERLRLLLEERSELSEELRALLDGPCEGERRLCEESAVEEDGEVGKSDGRVE